MRGGGLLPNESKKFLSACIEPRRFKTVIGAKTDIGHATFKILLLNHPDPGYRTQIINSV